MKASALGCAVAALVVAACASKPDVVELTPKGPTAEELYLGRFQMINGRTPTLAEKRRWEGEVEERVYAYLRQHPELRDTPRYSDFHMWWQVTKGSTPAEVRLLLEEPLEKTTDLERMAALAEWQWGEIYKQAREAWFYPPRWVIFFDEAGVVAIVHRVPSPSPWWLSGLGWDVGRATDASPRIPGEETWLRSR
jgi:hypothetical protein